MNKLEHYLAKKLLKYRHGRWWMPDRWFIEIQWKERMDYPLNLKQPSTFCEKLQWLKLHDHNPLYHRLVDKYEAKKWVAERIGEEHIIKTLAIYNSVEEIDFDSLPEKFVLKCTHDSGGYVVCLDKSELDRKNTRVFLKQRMKIRDYFYWCREWAYKGVKPRIIAEEYIDTLGKDDSIEYKLTCINGKVKMITVCSGPAHVEDEKRHNDHFDREGKRLPFSVVYKPAGLNLPSKTIVDRLVEIAERLSCNIPQVRVDLYDHNGQILFGEMTFYTWSGYMKYVPQEWDQIMGDWLELPQKRYKI